MELTQKKLSESVGINKVSICSWENGNQTIPMRCAIKICSFFKVNLDYLFELSDEKSPNKSYDYSLSKKRIREFRKIHNLTLRQLAKILNTTSSTISAYETGKTLILTSFSYQIAIKYNVSMDWLVGMNNKMRISK